jgi:hypothetical protein
MAANARAAFKKDLQDIRKASERFLDGARAQDAPIFYTRFAKFQIKNATEKRSRQKL